MGSEAQAILADQVAGLMARRFFLACRLGIDPSASARGVPQVSFSSGLARTATMPTAWRDLASGADLPRGRPPGLVLGARPTMPDNVPRVALDGEFLARNCR